VRGTSRATSHHGSPLNVRPFLAAMNEAESDPFDLRRFLDAQISTYDAALAELTAGAKTTHWMWFIFPQVEGLGFSSMAKRYAIRSRAEGRAYFDHKVLGMRLRECVLAVLSVQGRSALQIMGSPDDLKLRSSMTLFSEIAETGSPFEELLARYFSGEKDTKTLEFLRRDGVRGA